MGREIKVKFTSKLPYTDHKNHIKNDLKHDLAPMVISKHPFKVIFGGLRPKKTTANGCLEISTGARPFLRSSSRSCLRSF